MDDDIAASSQLLAELTQEPTTSHLYRTIATNRDPTGSREVTMIEDIPRRKAKSKKKGIDKGKKKADRVHLAMESSSSIGKFKPNDTPYTEKGHDAQDSPTLNRGRPTTNGQLPKLKRGKKRKQEVEEETTQPRIDNGTFQTVDEDDVVTARAAKTPVTPPQSPPRKKARKSQTTISTPATDKPKKIKKSRKSQTAPLSDPVNEQGNGASAADPISSLPNGDFSKSGKFDKDELDRMDAAIERYRVWNGLSKSEVINLIHWTKPKTRDPTERIDLQEEQANQTIVTEFWTNVHEALPERTRTAISKTARRRWHPFEQRGGKWTPEEDELLANQFEMYPAEWKKISIVVGRSPEDCRDRYRNYVVCRNNRKESVWTPSEEVELKKAVSDFIKALKDSRLQERGSLDGYDAAQHLDWNIISDKMGGQRSRIQCSYKWKQMARRDGDAPKLSWREKKVAEKCAYMLPGDKYDLISSIVKLNLPQEDKINWRLLSRNDRRKYWKPDDLKFAFRKMKEEVGQRDSIDELLNAMADHLSANHSFDELEEKYLPEGYKVPDDSEDDAPSTGKLRQHHPQKIKSQLFIDPKDDLTDDEETLSQRIEEEVDEVGL